MPSRPMLTTPARSDQRPPRPASMIGIGRDQRRGEGAGRREVVGTGDHLEQRRAGAARTGMTASSAPTRDPSGFGAGGGGGLDSVIVAGRSCRDLLGARRARCSRARATSLLLEPDAVAPHDLVGDDDGEHDDALGDRRRCRARRRPGSAAGWTARRGRRTAARRGRCRSGGCGRAGRSRCRRSRARTGRSSRSCSASPKRIGMPDQAGDRTGDQHRGDDHPLDVDAAGDGRGRRPAGGAQVEAEPGPVEHEPVERSR